MPRKRNPTQNYPQPMPDPCEACPARSACANLENYKCAKFKAIFIASWDKTVAFIRSLSQANP